ncbi:LOW QUALITY PROTEIN: hypothetical protein V1478_012848 [Vespula squamosa]|uniref:Uncharacterized protein n=1 Tax=Vespula squamosa TaxID=30214 RepID=A0ABD2A946_VESSQ
MILRRVRSDFRLFRGKLSAPYSRARKTAENTYAKTLINSYEVLRTCHQKSRHTDDRRVLPHKSVVTKHCPDYHVRGGPSSDGSDRLCCFLEVSTTQNVYFQNNIKSFTRTMREILEQSLNGRSTEYFRNEKAGYDRGEGEKERRMREKTYNLIETGENAAGNDIERTFENRSTWCGGIGSYIKLVEVIVGAQGFLAIKSKFHSGRTSQILENDVDIMEMFKSLPRKFMRQVLGNYYHLDQNDQCTRAI